MNKIKLEKMNLNVSDEELLQQMKEVVFNSYRAINYLKNHGLTEQDINDNVIKIFDFVSDYEYCNKCPGLEKCQKTNPHLCIRIVKKNNEIDRQFVPCSKIMERMSFESKFLLNDVDEQIIDKAAFVADSKKDSQEKNKLMVKQIQKEKNYNWYYFSYDNFITSIEKGYMVGMCLMQEYDDQIAYINFPNRVKELNDLYFAKDKTSRSAFDKRMEMLCNVPILIIEGLGDEFINDFNRDSIVAPIINTRGMKKLTTIFISKYKMDDILNLYSTSKSGEIRAKQMSKTIKMLCEQEFDD